MKKVLSLVIISIALFGCGNKSKKNVETVQEVAEVVVDNGVVGNVYKGVLPAADCDGIETTLTLNEDGSFVEKSVYLGKEGSFEEKGTYSVDGEIITLSVDQEDAKEAKMEYFRVEGDQIRMLNTDKTPVEGELADAYLLKKSMKEEVAEEVVEKVEK